MAVSDFRWEGEKGPSHAEAINLHIQSNQVKSGMLEGK